MEEIIKLRGAVESLERLYDAQNPTDPSSKETLKMSFSTLNSSVKLLDNLNRSKEDASEYEKLLSRLERLRVAIES